MTTTARTTRRIIVTAPARPALAPVATPAAPTCEDCGDVLSAATIRDYRRAANMGPRYRGIPRCCARCAARR